MPGPASLYLTTQAGSLPGLSFERRCAAARCRIFREGDEREIVVVVLLHKERAALFEQAGAELVGDGNDDALMGAKHRGNLLDGTGGLPVEGIKSRPWQAMGGKAGSGWRGCEERDLGKSRSQVSP